MFCIRMAELDIEINNHYSFVEDMCTDYIVPAAGKADMCIEVTDEDIAKEQQDSQHPFSKGYCESICIYRAISERLIEYDGFIMHGACIEYGGVVYAFLAKSGTGKTTHISLWKKVYGDDVHVINGDKPIIRLRDGVFYAYGTPWCGKERWNINTGAPLKALCFLERGDNNSIAAMGKSNVMNRLCHQILMPKTKEYAIRYLDMMDNLIRSTDCYILKCNMEDDAAKTACEGMSGK